MSFGSPKNTNTYHCDKLGMIVWQDMPSGDRGPQWQMHNYFTGEEKHRSAEWEANFRKEWKEIIDNLLSLIHIWNVRVFCAI